MTAALAVAVWPYLDAVPGGVQDQLAVDIGARFGHIAGGPLTAEGQRSCRWQQPHRVAQIPVLRATAETVRVAVQMWLIWDRSVGACGRLCDWNG